MEKYLQWGAPYTLHGLNAILLPEIGWYRVDPRGNRAGVNAQFIPPQEQLAFEIWSDQEVAQNERQIAQDEKQRADRLAAQLRALGINPDL